MLPSEDEFDKTICTCDCHNQNPPIEHTIACCGKCAKCGKRIITGLEEDHKKVCSEEPRNIENK